MNYDPAVHWHEGLFLQPHHLQVMQRQTLLHSAADRGLRFSYAFGVVDAQLSYEALANKLVRFERLRVVMPSGTVVEVPGNAHLPALSIERAFDAGNGPLLVYLGLPLWQEHRANVAENGSAGTAAGANHGRQLYVPATLQRPDENTGDNPQEIPVRQLNAKLLLAEDDKSELEYLPVLRVCHTAGQEQDVPREDPSYIPPALLVRGSRVLRRRLDALANLVEAARAELHRQLHNTGLTMAGASGEQIEQVLRLRTLGVYAPVLRHLAQSAATTPETAYLALSGLLGELSALVPARQEASISAYDHDNLEVCFAELGEAIPPLLSRGAAPYRSVEFVADGALQSASMSEEDLTRPIEYFLAIKTASDGAAVRALVEDGVKFRLDSRRKLLAPLVVKGMRLVGQHAPPGMPAGWDMHYFKLMRGDGANSVLAWENIRKEQSIAVRWRGMETSDFQLKLYLMLPETNA